MFEKVIFGFDGTLVNSLNGICAAVNATLENFDFLRIKDRDIFPMISTDTRKFLEDVLDFCKNSENIPENFEKLNKNDFLTDFSAEFSKNFEKSCMDQVMLYPEIARLLENLLMKNVKIGVFSTKSEKITRHVLEYFDIDEYFDEFDFYSEKKLEKSENSRENSKNSVLFVGTFDWELKLMKDLGFSVCKLTNPQLKEFENFEQSIKNDILKIDFFAESPSKILEII